MPNRYNTQVQAKITSIDTENHKVGLSIRELIAKKSAEEATEEAAPEAAEEAPAEEAAE